MSMATAIWFAPVWGWKRMPVEEKLSAFVIVIEPSITDILSSDVSSTVQQS